MAVIDPLFEIVLFDRMGDITGFVTLMAKAKITSKSVATRILVLFLLIDRMGTP